MSTEIISIPIQSPLFHGIKVIHRCKQAKQQGDNCANLRYLQSIRSGGVRKNDVDLYYAMLFRHTDLLTEEVVKQISELDAIFRPPSSRCDALPYLEKILLKFPNCKDVSSRFTKTSNIKSGEIQEFDEILKVISYQKAGDEDTWKTVLFVDDILNRGNTAAVTLNLLLEAGFPISSSFIIACPLWESF